jgi:hypothetical protein
MNWNGNDDFAGPPRIRIVVSGSPLTTILKKRSEPISGRRRQLLLLAHRARTNLDVIFGALSVVVFVSHPSPITQPLSIFFAL